MNNEFPTPLPQALLGGEGRVRGRHGDPAKRCGYSNRSPLAPTLSPIESAMGERKNLQRAA